MFKKLRNKLIWINLGITSVVILVVFTFIYVISTRSADERPPEVQSITITRIDSYGNASDEIQRIIFDSLNAEKEAAARQLLIMLIISGIAIEVAVAIVSYYLAEQAIKPIREAYESQKIFIANASHEIKTPLAAISANLEAADIKDNKWIKNVEIETEKLTTLNNELLNLARTDLVTETTTEDVDITKLTAKLISGFEPRFQNIKFTSHMASTSKIKLNTKDFSQIFGILMDNAIKYCDHKITLNLKNHELSITNDGTTITKNDIVHIFDRFYQADKSTEGVGLGLSIAKTLADRNHWQISANSDHKNTTFTLVF